MKNLVQMPFAEYGRFHCFLETLCATECNDSVLSPGRTGRTGRRRPEDVNSRWMFKDRFIPTRLELPVWELL
jgi:hypothetical protein